jgi:DNA polymerase elongation subunit (family B)
VFPYCYVLCDESVPTADPAALKQFMFNLCHGINRASEPSLNHGQPRRGGSSLLQQQVVYKIVPVHGRQFYGFHSGASLFLKVYLFDPDMLGLVSHLLRRGSVLSRPFKVFEAHIPYLLQVFVDYNLFGMGLAHFASAMFRSPMIARARRSEPPPPDAAASGDARIQHRWWTDDVLASLAPSPAPRLCTTELELDVDATHVLNAHERVTATQALDSQVSMVPQLALLWDDERLRRVADNLDPTPSQPPTSHRERPTLTDTALFATLRERFAKVCAADSERVNVDDLKRLYASMSQSGPTQMRDGSSATAAEQMISRHFGAPTQSSLAATNYANNAMLALEGEDLASAALVAQHDAFVRSQAAVVAEHEAFLQSQAAFLLAADDDAEHSAHSQLARQQSDLEVISILDSLKHTTFAAPPHEPQLGVGSRTHSDAEDEADEDERVARDQLDILQSQMPPVDVLEDHASGSDSDSDSIDSDVIIKVPQIDGGTSVVGGTKRRVKFGGLEVNPAVVAAVVTAVASSTAEADADDNAAEDEIEAPQARRRRRRKAAEADAAPPPPPADETAREADTNAGRRRKRRKRSSKAVGSDIAVAAATVDAGADDAHGGNDVEDAVLPVLSAAIPSSPIPSPAVPPSSAPASVPAPQLTSPVGLRTRRSSRILAAPLVVAPPAPKSTPRVATASSSSSSSPRSASPVDGISSELHFSAPVAPVAASTQWRSPDIATAPPVMGATPPRSPVIATAPAVAATPSRSPVIAAAPPRSRADAHVPTPQSMSREQLNQVLSTQVPFTAGSAVRVRLSAYCSDTFVASPGVNRVGGRAKFRFALRPPSAREVRADLKARGERDTEHPEPFYSDVRDRPLVPPTFAGQRFVLPTGRVADLPEFDTAAVRGTTLHLRSALTSLAALRARAERDVRQKAYRVTFAPAQPPPTAAMVRADIAATEAQASLLADGTAGTAASVATADRSRSPSPWDPSVPPPPRARAVPDVHPMQRAANERHKVHASQIEAPTQCDPHEYAFSQTPADKPGESGETNNHVTLMSVELHCASRGELQPHPQVDAVCAIAYCVKNDDELAADRANYRYARGLLYWWDGDAAEQARYAPVLTSAEHGLTVRRFANEIELLTAFVQLVRDVDPDILAGFELRMASLGYLVERANWLNVDLCEELARMPTDDAERTRLEARNRRDAGDADQKEPGGGDGGGGSRGGRGGRGGDYGGSIHDHCGGIYIVGRVMFNVWWIMRAELTLRIYTFNNIVYHVLHRRMPEYDAQTLHAWFAQPQTRSRCLEHVLARAVASVDLLSHLNVVGRTAELARLFGIDFDSVVFRGSQYRVESMMLRLTKPQNYVLISVGKEKVPTQDSPECTPLVMEPRSALYNDPVLVLDFQSLYPSIVIAYNLCFSTCLGRVASALEAARKFGCDQLPLPPGLLAFLSAGADTTPFLAPNDVMFMPATARLGVLPRMLREILETRVMVKSGLKRAKQRGDRAAARMLDARQFGLKMIANVTYGYTSASFTGRMPCAELADSIVMTARETLEAAIRLSTAAPSGTARRWSTATPTRCLCACRAPRSGARLRSASRSPPRSRRSIRRPCSSSSRRSTFRRCCSRRSATSGSRTSRARRPSRCLTPRASRRCAATRARPWRRSWSARCARSSSPRTSAPCAATCSASFSRSCRTACRCATWSSPRRCASARTSPASCRRRRRSSVSSACRGIRARSRCTASACATPSSTARPARR